MVEDLLDQPGSAYDPVLYEFIGDVKNDQLVEIERMHALLVTLSDDPRANLTAGLYDAGIAIKNLRLISTQTKPPGFIDPKIPANYPKRLPEDATEKSESQTGEAENAAAESADKAKPTEGKDGRYAMLSFSNTDMAFPRHLVAGNYHGFNIYDISAKSTPELITSVVCLAVRRCLRSWQSINHVGSRNCSRLDCGLQGVAEDVSDERFRGIRILTSAIYAPQNT